MRQQDFLQEAMAEMDLTQEAFATRLGTSIRTLERWLLPESDADFLQLGDATWSLVRDILAHERQQKKNLKNG